MGTELRVLMVEDSEDDAELIRIELSLAGYELIWKRVETESDFIAALEETWDLIISDYQMPEFDGLRAFALYEQRELDTPFIFVSGALGEERAVEAMRAGARDYLLKGNLARLSVAVKRELREAHDRRLRRDAEEAARREQRRLAMAVEASGAAIFEHRIPWDDQSYFSKRWAELLGYDELPRYASIGAWLSDLADEDDLDDLMKSYEDFIEGRSERLEMEARLVDADARPVNVAWYAKANRDASGRATDVVGVVLDLTERRKLEAQLRQAQKMEAVGRLAGGVAHDFNNLLTAIFSFGNFVLEALPRGEEVHEDMLEVMKAAKKAEALTAQLLAFSRRKPVSPTVLSVNQLIQDMDRMLRRIVGEDVELTIELAPHIWNVRVDQGSFEQVIVNLLVNARDAMEQGGKVHIETRNATLAADHGGEDVTVVAGDYVLVAVSDDGIGMDEETQRHIFEPFFTTKDVHKGTGLGLSTCYGIIKQANGHILVASELGAGTTFSIYLPRVADSSDAATVATEPETTHGSETILVVEDDEQVRRLAVRALSALGYRIIAASHGAEALELCTSEVSLVLTDVVMPAMSGSDLVAQLTQRLPGLRVLYMSGYAANTIVHRGVLEPGTQLLQKPFTPVELARKVRAVLDA